MGRKRKAGGEERRRGGRERGREKEEEEDEQDSAELSHSVKVSDRLRDTSKSVQHSSESLCADLWVPCRVFWVWFGPALDPNLVQNRRFPAGSLKVFGAL